MTRFRRTWGYWVAIALLGVLAVAGPAIAQYFAQTFVLDGSPSAPGYAFNSATSTGLYRNSGLPSVAVAVAGAAVAEFAATGPRFYGGTSVHDLWTQSTTPTTGGTAMVANSTDVAGQVTAGGSSVTVTFQTAWTSPVICTGNVQNRSGVSLGAQMSSSNATQVVFLGTSSGDTVGYMCRGF